MYYGSVKIIYHLLKIQPPLRITNQLTSDKEAAR